LNYEVSLNNQVVASTQTGTNTYTLFETAPVLDNLISIKTSGPYCDSQSLNILDRTGKSDQPYLINSLQALLCMQSLVNSDVLNYGGELYREGHYWQFGSIDGESQTLFPMGSSASPFSGHIFADPELGKSGKGSSGGTSSGAAVISNLIIEGETANNTDYIGLFAAVSNDFTLTGVHLKDVSVDGSLNVGAIIGAIQPVIPGANVTIQDCTVSGTVNGTVNGAVSSSSIGGLVGYVPADATLSLINVSFTGAVGGQGADTVGGLVGMAAGEVNVMGGAYEGELTGDQNVGGLIGYAEVSLRISQAAVRLKFDNSAGSFLGGLVGALVPVNPTSPVPLSIDNVVVVGSITGSQNVAGLVGHINAATSDVGSVSLTSIIQAVELSATSFAAGLIIPYVNQTNSMKVYLKSVLNLAQSTSVSPSNSNSVGALIVTGNNNRPSEILGDQLLRWQGVSSDTATYLPFADGGINTTNQPWRQNGYAIDCSNFSNEAFWTNTASMNLSTAVWNFETIVDGYLPSLNGKFADQPFSCMNKITADEDWTPPVQADAEFGSAVLPIEGTSSTLAHYFTANSDPEQAVYTFTVNQSYHPYDIIFNGKVGLCQGTSSQKWYMPPSGLFRDGTISLKENTCTGPEFAFRLTQTGDYLWLSWSTTYASTVSLDFTTIVNLPGGTPPGMSRSQFTYEGLDSSGSWNIGPPMAGTYSVTVSGFMTRVGELVTEDVSGNLSWSKYLHEIVPQSTISFPDVFVGSARTISYKSGANVTVSQVKGVNQGRMEAIYWLVSVKIAGSSQSTVSGKATYRAQDTVNRGPMAQFLQRLAGFSDAQIAARYQNRVTKFTDIASLKKSNLTRYYAILWLEDMGITKGCNAAGTLFCADQPTTRGMMAEFLLRLSGVTAVPATTSPFSDVNSTSKWLKYDGTRAAVLVEAIDAARMGAINWLYLNKITLGSGAISGRTAFRPQDTINRGSMAELMRKLALLVGSFQ
jgi:hypothetical protein